MRFDPFKSFKSYPYPSPAVDWPIERPPLQFYLRSKLRERKNKKRSAAPSITITLECETRVAPDTRNPIIITVVKNGIDDIRSFLTHYRRLGAERFAIVDDQSSDGTTELLLQQSDVDLFTSPATYPEAKQGLIWRELLASHYGRGRWYVSVDSDEYLIYPDCETVPLAAFIQSLERQRIQHLHAPMLDLYPRKPLSEANLPEHPDEMPNLRCPYIDGDSYTMRRERSGLAVRGGPRARLFGLSIRMTKFPLLFVDDRTSFAAESTHSPAPLTRNFTPPGGALLHNKFSHGAVQKIERAVAEQSHFGGSKFYRAMTEHDNFHPSLNLHYEGSVKYENSQQMERLGFFRRF